MEQVGQRPAHIKRLLDAQAACEEDEEAELVYMNAIQQILKESRPKKKRRGGSLPGKAPNLRRDHFGAQTRLYEDYFAENPKYPARVFRRRFRMSRGVYNRLHDAVVGHDRYFVQRPDAAGRCGLSSHQKIVAALRMLCYGDPADRLDEHLQISETSALKSLDHFIDAVIACFEDEYLRQPTADDIARHAKANEKRGFPGMFGSLDCTHWVWKNCPYGLKGQYQDRSGKCSMIMEAVATEDLWIWHAFIGLPGSNNDLNVLGRSPLIVDWMRGHAPDYEYHIDGKPYKSCYLLCDGIYPEWSVFVKTISKPQGEKEKWFACRQEAARKDVERAFGVLQGRFAILQHPARRWNAARLRRLWKAMIIMHNMIVEDQHVHAADYDEDADEEDDDDDEGFENFVPVHVQSTAGEQQAPRNPNEPLSFDRYLLEITRMRDADAHAAIQQDLINHLWKREKRRRRAHYGRDTSDEDSN